MRNTSYSSGSQSLDVSPILKDTGFMEKARRSHTVHRTICHDPQQPRGEAKLMGGSCVRGSEQTAGGELNARGAALSLGAPSGCPVPATVPPEGKFMLGSGSESQG